MRIEAADVKALREQIRRVTPGVQGLARRVDLEFCGTEELQVTFRPAMADHVLRSHVAPRVRTAFKKWVDALTSQTKIWAAEKPNFSMYAIREGRRVSVTVYLFGTISKTGTATCSPEDTFSAVTGLTVAFLRAVESVPPACLNELTTLFRAIVDDETSVKI
jgi:hypothetical protein